MTRSERGERVTQERMTCRHHIHFEKGASKDLIQSVRPIVQQAVASAQAVLPIETNVSIMVAPDSREWVSLYMHGSTGWTPDSRHVHIGIDTGARGWRGSLKSVVAHELNHTVRFHRTGTHKGQLTMRDTIAFDGLAQCFETEVCGKRPPYASALSSQQVKKTWRLVKDQLDSLDEGLYRRVFFARDDKEVPTWAGYRISFMIVSRMKKRSGLGWDELMGLSSEEIVGSGIS